ncbi:MAG: iron-containing alcohol dehydrogenase, partial [Bryobacteraceae bacterium]
MNAITLLTPPRIVFGNGCASGCAELLADRGMRRVLLVSSKSVLPRIDFLIDGLRKAGCSVATSEPVGPEPTLAGFDTILAAARKLDFDAVVGVGGGSVLDVAKLIAALTQGSQQTRDVFGVNRCEGRRAFLICLPTTAGAGSEVSPNAVLVDEAEQLK